MAEFDVSIIIPVYNVEKYVGKCIESAINQHTNFMYEVIIVDDGSTDRSGKICDSYKEKFDNIKIIHKENEGLGYARNTGIDIASGDYIMFLDSDDWYLPNTVERAFTICETYNCDIGCFQYIRTRDREYEYDVASKKIGIEIYNKNRVIYEYITSLNRCACTKIYKRNIFNEERFSDTPLHEDSWSMHLFLDRCDRVAVTDEVLYIQYVRNESLTTTSFSSKNLLQLEVGERLIQFCKAKYPEYVEEARCSAIFGAYGLVCKILDEGKSDFINNRLSYFQIIARIKELKTSISKAKIKEYCREQGIMFLNTMCNMPEIYAYLVILKKNIYRRLVRLGIVKL